MRESRSIAPENTMGAPITLFSGYSHGENRTTNYCLLVLKMLYEENPKLLGEIKNLKKFVRFVRFSTPTFISR